MKSLNYLSVLLCGAAIAACTPETQQVTTTETVTKVEVVAIEPSDAPRYTSSPETGHTITIPVNLGGKLVGVQMWWEYRSKCENEHRAFFIAPNGRITKVLDGGLERCSGRWENFGSQNDFSDVFAGMSPKGDWIFSMADKVSNDYSGRILTFTLVLKVDDGSGVVTHRFDVPGPDADIPQPN